MFCFLEQSEAFPRKRVQISHGKQAIGVRVIEVLFWIVSASVQKLTKQELSKSQIEKTNTDESNTLPVEEMMPDKGKKRSLPGMISQQLHTKITIDKASRKHAYIILTPLNPTFIK